jgi:hypothetical protein
MSKKVYIGCGAGFAGDRFDASIPIVKQLVNVNAPKYLIFEVLAERTLALAQQLRNKNSEEGYSPFLDSYINPILEDCLENNIKIVSNIGAANPMGAAKRILEIAEKQKIRKPKIGVVIGDDLLAYMSNSEILESPTMEGLDFSNNEITAANVYLGAQPIADALEKGADIVIVGRSVDSALVLGPLIYEYKWKPNELNLMASGTICGHLLECGAQVTGAYFADPGYKDVPDLANVGFPIAEVNEDGSFVITKPDGTGGLVNKATVTEQLLYETHNPSSYLVPDVTADMSALSLENDGVNRILVKGANGKEPPKQLKATICCDNGFMGEAEISYAGLNALARARLAGDVIDQRIQKIGLQGQMRIEIIGAGSVHYSIDETSSYNLPNDGDYRVRTSAIYPHREQAQQMVDEVISLYCCGPSAGGGGRAYVTPQTSTASILVDREIVDPNVQVKII